MEKNNDYYIKLVDDIVQSANNIKLKKIQLGVLIENAKELRVKESNILNARNIRKSDRYSIELMFDEGSAILKSNEDWILEGKNYNYYVVYEGKIESEAYSSKDHAMLGYLSIKYQGRNTDFPSFAYRMLEMYKGEKNEY